MTRIVLLRGLLIVALTGLAVVASWAIPKLGAPPDRFGVAMQLIDQGRAVDAIYLLKDKPWRGVAEYRAGRYQHRAGGDRFLAKQRLGLHRWQVRRQHTAGVRTGL